LLCVTISGATSGSRNEFGTPQEAKAMLDRAVIEIRADKLKAIDKFNHNDIAFRDRDLFVFCFNAGDGRFTAHEAMVSHNVKTLRDKDGTPFGEQMYDEAWEEAVTEVVYLSPVPGSIKQTSKSAFITRIGDQVCGVSVYRPRD
jgi:hypothetical protein